MIHTATVVYCMQCKLLFFNNVVIEKRTWFEEGLVSTRNDTNVSGVYPSSASVGLGQDFREEE
jgi:hypothetical protein